MTLIKNYPRRLETALLDVSRRILKFDLRCLFLRHQYPASPRGPANSQMMNPRAGRTRTSTIQKTLEPVVTRLWKILTIAHTSAIRISKPKKPPNLNISNLLIRIIPEYCFGQDMAQEHLNCDGLLNTHDSAHSNRILFGYWCQGIPIYFFAILAQSSWISNQRQHIESLCKSQRQGSA